MFIVILSSESQVRDPKSGDVNGTHVRCPHSWCPDFCSGVTFFTHFYPGKMTTLVINSDLQRGLDRSTAWTGQIYSVDWTDLQRGLDRSTAWTGQTYSVDWTDVYDTRTTLNTEQN